MKAIIICAIVLTSLQVYSQQTTSTRSSTGTAKAVKTTNTQKTTSRQTSQPAGQVQRASQKVPATTTTSGQVTNSGANGATSGSTNGNTPNKPAAKSPFVGGIHAAPDAGKTLDKPSANTAGSANNNNAGGVSIAGPNDTTFNVNTINQGGVTTNSGAVDRSGQSQFGQTNWGRNNRNTVGESQWTVPPPITSSFNKQFPGANSVEWQRNQADTTRFMAHYNFGGTWVTTIYNNSGEKLETRTEIPLVQAPRPVSVYLAKQSSTFRIATISRLQLQGKPQVYEIKTSAGKTIYINDDGMETTL